MLLLGGAALLAPAVWAQTPGRTYRIGVPGSDRRVWAPLFDELRANGFVEGKNLAIVGEFGLPMDHYDVAAAELAKELVKAGVDAILTAGALRTRAAQRATQSIPILTTTDDPVGEGFAASLAHPGGNITGIAILAPELDRKRQEILLELVPSARHVAALADPDTTPPQQLQALEEDARSRNIELSIHRAKTREEIVPAIEAARAAGAQAINVLSSLKFYVNRALIIESVAKARLPAVFQFAEWAEQGALVGYGPPLARYLRQLARQLVKVLNGTAPADIPVEQPTAIELAINLKTAKALGLTVPPALLIRADKVIE
ncbi:MAG TPA: ABC transporter substrate-binding protein [Bradyrhizobium sp.]|nr:ABC transporter substrate-binding protein [Bradyrhizobium sp.]